MPHTTPQPRRFLVIQLARLGDLLQTKRLILSLQARPGAEVHLLLDHSLGAAAALAYPGALAHFLPAHRAGSPGPGQILGQCLPVLRELAGLDFAEVYNLNFSGLNFALSTLFPAEAVRGYRMENGQPLLDHWTRLAFRWTRRRQTALLNLVDLWGLLAPDPAPPGAVNPVAQAKGGGIGVVLAGRHSRRSLPPKVLAPLVHACARGVGAKQVVLLGAQAERPLSRELYAAFPASLANITRDLCGRTSLAELAEVLSGLDQALTPDTGTMHLAAHLGTPVQAFFLSSAWCWETGPYGLGHRAWQAITECAPCLESAPCDHDLRCLQPFAGRELLKHLSGNPEFEAPEGLLGLASTLDPLGCAYIPVLGQDPYADERQALRALAAEHLGQGYAGDLGPDAAGRLFSERDWMLDDSGVPDLMEII
jgi:ADP-heptose:LPS heptosyltransferase